ncbi:autotransporter domain-containing protein [Rhizobium halophytocola]
MLHTTALAAGILLSALLFKLGHAAELIVDNGDTVLVNDSRSVDGIRVNDGTLQINNGGAVTVLPTQEQIVGDGAGAAGKVTVSGEGSQLKINQNSFLIGNAGNGTVEVDGGATVWLPEVFLGREVGSSGTITVTGEGSSVKAGGRVHVGVAGNGLLSVTGGSHMSANGISIGFTTADDITAAGEVSGQGSLLTSSSDIVVGESGEGTLAITEGGAADAEGTTAGNSAGSSGKIGVSGPSSTLTTANLRIGNQGDGSLQIDNGARAQTHALTLGAGATGYGSVTVAGSGSMLTADDAITVGEYGTGTLNLMDGARVSADTLFLGQLADADGTVNIGSASGEAAAAAGLLDASKLVFGNGSGTIIFNYSDADYLFSADVAGYGAFIQEAGFTHLTGDYSAFTGKVDVAGGTVSIDSDAGPSLAVLDGAALAGTGAAGDVVFEDGARFVFGLTQDFLNTSTLTIGQDVSVALAPTNGRVLHPGDAYTIIDWSDAPVSGAFEGVTSDFADEYAFFDVSLNQVANSIVLNVDRNGQGFSDVALTRNQRATAKGIESLGEGEIFDAVINASAAGARAGFDAMSGEIHASVMAGQLADGAEIRNAVNDRMRGSIDPFVTGSIAPGQGSGRLDEPVQYWGQARHGRSDVDTDGNAAAMSSHNGGLLAGVDAEREDWLAGAAAGFSHARFRVDDRASSADSDNFHLAFYGARTLGPASFRGGIAYDFRQTDTDRDVSVLGLDQHLTAGYDSHTLQAFGEVAYRIDTDVATLEPFTGISGSLLIDQGYQESGGSAALKARTQIETLPLATLGMRADRIVQLASHDVRLHGSVAVQHSFGDRDISTTQNFAGGRDFTVYATPASINTALIEAGLDLPLTRSANLGFAYQGAFDSDHNSQAFSTRLNIAF